MSVLRGLRRRPGDQTVRVVPGSQKDMAEFDVLYATVSWTAPKSIRTRDRFLVARVGRVMVGALMYWVDDEPAVLPQAWTDRFGESPRLLVQEIAVAPAHRRTGIGRALMAAAARDAIEAGIPYLWTSPSERGTDAERAGRVAFFTFCGMRVFLPRNPLEMVGTSDAVFAASTASG